MRSRWVVTTPVRPGPNGTRPPRTSAPVPRSSRSAAAPPPGTPAPTPTHPTLLNTDSSATASRETRMDPQTNRGVGGAVAEVLEGVRAGQEVGEAEIVTLFGARGPEVAAVAGGGRRPAPPGGRGHRHLRGQPQHQLHQRVHLQVHVLRVLQGPAVAEPARRPVPAVPRRRRPTRRRGRRTRGHRGVPPRRHPPHLRRRLLPRRPPRGEGRRPRHARPRVHRPRGHRGRQTPRRTPRRRT